MSQLSRGDILGRLAMRESLRGVNLVRADLSEIGLMGADLSEANLRMADLNRADLREARMNGCHLSGATMNGANLVGANLVEASMIGVSLKGAQLARADLSGADLTGANLDSACLSGAYLVGAYLNETSLNGADLSGAYVRMAQIGGSNLAGASLEGADFSQADLSGAHMEGCSLVGANMLGASLSGSYLTGCDLRGANVAGADLSGCNLTGAKLFGIAFEGVKLDDAWAEWVDMGESANGSIHGSLEDAFANVTGKPMAEVLFEGQVSDDVWAEIISHLREFHVVDPVHADVRLRAIQQGVNSAVLYLEADAEVSIAAYLMELGDIVGKGSAELLEKLAEVASPEPSELTTELDLDDQTSDLGTADFVDDLDASLDSLFNDTPSISATSAPAGPAAAPAKSIERRTRLSNSSRLTNLQGTSFWNSEKAFAILTGKRRIWLEAASSDLLTLRPAHGIVSGVDLIRGRFVPHNGRRVRFQSSRPANNNR
jgi:uncharacterized protein YjbI with pentapeptide repeats